jgi:hypothetical protein
MIMLVTDTGAPACALSLSGVRARAHAWRRIIDAVAEQKAALQHRIDREGIDDTMLAADCQTWCELSRALADFLKTRRAAS